MDEREVDWSALPMEILLLIGKTLQDRIDVIRFRSICAPWRSSIPPLREVSPSLPLPLPYPYHLRLELADDDDNPKIPTCSSNSWLVRVEEFEPGRTRLLNPFSSLHIRFLPDRFPKVINLLDSRVVEVSKAYELQYSSGMPIAGVNKLTLIFALLNEGKLGHVKHGDKKWTLVDDHNFDYDDIIVYKGQSYVVDRLGTVSRINSSMKLIQFSPPFCGLGNQKHLVESCGELYIVDRYFEFNREGGRWHFDLCFKVYKLDQEWGCWVMVKNLGDRVFILGNDCSFSVSAREFSECKGNSIYFTDGNDIGVFYVENQRICMIVDYKDQCPIFCPPPSWLSSKSAFI
ncbi:hypothetical protein ACB098_02G212300 [Castanea mollissima]